ncbi:MAG: oligosaccharide flippase family protein [Tannerellaceae bacterium]|nr:oligosaccharide flippase family protein [Tannerellaceae bacterium]
MGVIIRQSVKGTIINYIGAFLGFLITFFVQTHFLKPEEIGLLGVIYEAAFLLSTLCLLGTGSSAIRFFPYFKDEEKKHNGFFFYMLMVPLIGSILFIPLYLLLRNPISDYFSRNSAAFAQYYTWVIPLILFIVYWTVFECYSSLMLRIAAPRFISEVVRRLLLLGLYLLYGYGVINIDGLVAGYILTYGILALCCFFYISAIGDFSLKHDTSFVNKALRAEIGKYTAFLVVGTVGTTLIGRLDLFMVSAQMGLDYAGIYRIAFYMVAIIWIPMQSITAISAPLAADMMAKEDTAAVSRLFGNVALHQFIAGSLIFLFVWINIDAIFTIIPHGEQYKAGKWVVFFMSMAKLIEVTFIFGGTVIAYSKYYYWRLYFTFFLAVITIIGNLYLIPRLGITGAALAMLITTILSYTLQQWLIFRKIKINPYSFNLLKQVGAVIVLLGINQLLPTLSNPWLDCIYRSAVLVVPALVLIYVLNISPEIRELVRSVWKAKGN